jgi:hypothetical protein
MKKVTDNELIDIKNLRETLFEIVSSIGELSLNKFQVENQLKEIEQYIKEQQDKFLKFQEKERVLFEQLQTKYGTGNIDIETGEITE